MNAAYRGMWMFGALLAPGAAAAADPETVLKKGDASLHLGAAFGYGAGTGPVRSEVDVRLTAGPADGRLGFGIMGEYRPGSLGSTDTDQEGLPSSLGAAGALGLLAEVTPVGGRRPAIEPRAAVALGARLCESESEPDERLNGCIFPDAPASAPWGRAELGLRVHLLTWLGLDAAVFADGSLWRLGGEEPGWGEGSIGVLVGGDVGVRVWKKSERKPGAGGKGG